MISPPIHTIPTFPGAFCGAPGVRFVVRNSAIQCAFQGAFGVRFGCVQPPLKPHGLRPAVTSLAHPIYPNPDLLP